MNTTNQRRSPHYRIGLPVTSRSACLSAPGESATYPYQAASPGEHQGWPPPVPRSGRRMVTTAWAMSERNARSRPPLWRSVAAETRGDGGRMQPGGSRLCVLRRCEGNPPSVPERRTPHGRHCSVPPTSQVVALVQPPAATVPRPPGIAPPMGAASRSRGTSGAGDPSSGPAAAQTGPASATVKPNRRERVPGAPFAPTRRAGSAPAWAQGGKPSRTS